MKKKKNKNEASLVLPKFTKNYWKMVLQTLENHW
jgi:hypothetical protein